MSIECPICFNEFDNEKNIITCQYCQYKCCKECAKKWLLQQLNEFKCINVNCKKTWNIEFICNNFSIKFFNNELKNNYAEICYIAEKQFHINKYINIRDFCNNLNYIFKTILDNNINFKKYTFYYKTTWGGPYRSEYIIDNIYSYSLYNLMELHNLFKEYISFNMFYKLFSLYELEIFINVLSIFIYYNIISDNTSIFKDTFEKVLKKIYPLIKSMLNIEFPSYMSKPNNNIIYFFQNQLKIDNKNSIDLQIFINTYNHIKETYSNYDILQHIINIINNCDYFKEFTSHEIIKQNRKFYKCFKLNCDGDVIKLKTQLKCEKCKTIFCIKCGVEIFPKQIEYITEDNTIETEDNPNYKNYTIEQKNHICKKEDIENINILVKNRNSKFCPNCGVPIEKNDGCSDMFCTICKTFFNWNTLVITKINTNPLGLQYLHETNSKIPRFNHPDAQPRNDEESCDGILSFAQCLYIVEKYLDKNDSKYINFIKLLELKLKPTNMGKMDMYRKKLVFNLITEDQFKKYITTLYVSKFFIDNYNAIILNTTYMISELFKHIRYDGLNSDIKIDEYNRSMNEIIQIHNNAITTFNNVYPNFRIQLINNEFNTDIHIKNKIISKNIKYNLLTIRSDDIYYLNSPLKNCSAFEIKMFDIIYSIFLLFHYHVKYNSLYKIHRNLLVYFPSFNILNNRRLYDLLTNREVFNSLFEKNSGYDKYFKQANYTNYKLILKSYIIYVLLDNLITLSDFEKYYNKLINIILNSDRTYEKIIYTEQLMLNEDYFKDYINRIKLIQHDLHAIYKKQKTDLINKMNKYNINTDNLINETIFNKRILIYVELLIHEKDYMDIIDTYRN